MALLWARRIGNIRTPMPITNAELRSISAAPAPNNAVELLRSSERTMPTAMRLPTPYVKKPARKRAPTIRAVRRTLESGGTTGGEVEWLEAGIGSSRKTPTVTAIRLCDMNFSLDSPFVRRLGWLGAVPRLNAVQITLGSGGSGHDGVGCTTEGVSTPDRAGTPL